MNAQTQNVVKIPNGCEVYEPELFTNMLRKKGLPECINCSAKNDCPFVKYNNAQKARWTLYNEAKEKGLPKRRGGYSVSYLKSWLSKHAEVMKVTKEFEEMGDFLSSYAGRTVKNWLTAKLTPKEIRIAQEFKKHLDYLNSIEEMVASYQTSWAYGGFKLFSKYYERHCEIEDYAYRLRLYEIELETSQGIAYSEIDGNIRLYRTPLE